LEKERRKRDVVSHAEIRAFTGGSIAESYMWSFMEIITEFRALARIRKDTV
jgi:hypothetical protein